MTATGNKIPATLIPGANIGDQAAIFEAVHGSAPDIAVIKPLS